MEIKLAVPPPGLNLAGTGGTAVITGTPSAAGTYRATVTLSDGDGESVSKEIVFAVTA